MGISQKELASRLGVTPSRISNWEQGANCPTIDILFEVCKVLNVSIIDREINNMEAREAVKKRIFTYEKASKKMNT